MALKAGLRLDSIEEIQCPTDSFESDHPAPGVSAPAEELIWAI
jgi:hypothetical protein